jgi:OOP family OmpA-OmpF porin
MRGNRALGRSAAGAVILAGVLAAQQESVANAAETDGFALNRFDPAERGSDWFALESLDLRGHGRWATGIVGDWSHRPLVLYDEAGNEVRALLRDQLYAHVGGSVVWFDRLRVSATFPLLLVSDGGPATAQNGNLGIASGANLGDLRLSGDVRVLGDYGDVVSLALGSQVYLPTGATRAYSGDGRFRAQPHALLAGKLGRFEYAGRTGLSIREKANFAGTRLGSEWLFGAAAGVRLMQDRLLLGPELWGSTLVSSSLGAFDKEGTPVEALAGAHYRVHGWDVGLGAGPGLSRGFGAPALRMLASLQWVEDVEPAPVAVPVTIDRDADGIPDEFDACPSQAGVRNPDPTQNGCPAPVDADGDGILDKEDACPAQPGERSTDAASNGCPPRDTDADGIVDREDACVSEPGVRSPEPGRNGCPAPQDRDRDTVHDDVDACPDQPGEPSGDRATSGCPRVALKGSEVLVLDRIEFETGKANLRPESEPVLAAVATLLQAHLDIRKLEIQGHTDNQGQHVSNIDLSRRRARAVLDWFVQHGIAAERLSASGFGSDRPIDDNATGAGRTRNRRVEFRVLEQGEP